VNSNDLAVVN